MGNPEGCLIPLSYGHSLGPKNSISADGLRIHCRVQMQVHFGLPEIPVEQQERMAAMLRVNHKSPARGSKKSPALELVVQRNVSDVSDDLLIARFQDPPDRPPLTSPVDRIVDPEVAPFLELPDSSS